MLRKPPADQDSETELDAGQVKLAWGTPARWKARWREESLERHLALPVGERLRSALSLVKRQSDEGAAYPAGINLCGQAAPPDDLR